MSKVHYLTGSTRCGQFSAKMAAEGYIRTDQRLHFAGADTQKPRDRIMSFVRSHR